MSIRNKLLQSLTSTLFTHPSIRPLLRVVTATREDIKIASDGQFFNLDIPRFGIIPTGTLPNLSDTSYFKIVTGDKILVIENIVTDVLETTGATARYSHDAFIYFSNSDRNEFTISVAGSPLSPRSLNSGHINDIPLSTIEAGVTATIDSGTYDLRPLHYESIVNSQGNNKTRNDVSSAFFSDGKVIVVEPNTTVLVQSVLISDVAVEIDLFTQVFISEYDVGDA